MAKNFKYSGKKIILQNIGAAVASGSLCRRNGFIGIPETHAAAGASVTFCIDGVWGFTYSHFSGIGAGALPVAGCVFFWDTSVGTLSVGSASDDFAAVKAVTPVSSVDGTFEGLLLPQSRAVGLDQA